MDNLEQNFKCALILANTYIKNSNLDKWLLQLKEKLDLAKVKYKIFINDYPNRLDDYNELIIIGGDGSINYVINKYKTINIPISIIPLGTGNDLYATLNNDDSINIEKSLTTSIYGKPQYIDAVMCNEQIFLNTFSVGFDAQVTYDSIKIANFIPHKFKYIIATLKNILSYTACSYTVNDKTDKYTQLTIMNGPRYGNGIKISPDSNLCDEIVELIKLQEFTNIFAKIKFLIKLKSGTHIYDKLCDVIKIHDTLIISCTNEVRYQIDGESNRGNYFILKILPKRYQFKV